MASDGELTRRRDRDQPRESGVYSMSEARVTWASGRRETIYLPSNLEAQSGDTTLVGLGVVGVTGVQGEEAIVAARSLLPSSDSEGFQHRTTGDSIVLPPRSAQEDRARSEVSDFVYNVRKNLSFKRCADGSISLSSEGEEELAHITGESGVSRQLLGRAGLGGPGHAEQLARVWTGSMTGPRPGRLPALTGHPRPGTNPTLTHGRPGLSNPTPKRMHEKKNHATTSRGYRSTCEVITESEQSVEGGRGQTPTPKRQRRSGVPKTVTKSVTGRKAGTWTSYVLGDPPNWFWPEKAGVTTSSDRVEERKHAWECMVNGYDALQDPNSALGQQQRRERAAAVRQEKRWVEDREVARQEFREEPEPASFREH